MKSLWMMAMLGMVFIAANGPVVGNEANDADGVSITVSPNVLVIGQDIGAYVTVNSNIPGILPAEALTLTSDAESGSATAVASFLDSMGQLVVKFDKDAVEGIVKVGQVVLTLNLDGEALASDAITVKRAATRK